MIKTFFLAILLSFSSVAFGDISEVCQNYEKVGNMVIPYAEQFWIGTSATPAGPVPTVTNFALVTRSPITDFCAMVIQFKRLDETGKTYLLAEYANKLSGDQYSKEINMVRSTHDMGEALSNVNKPGRKLDQSTSFHRRLNSYLKEGDEFINGDKAKTFENKSQRERKMTQLVRSSNQIALIEENTRCPKPEMAEEDKNIKYYQEEILPLSNLIDEQKSEIAYFVSQLQRMGIKISVSYEDNELFQKALYEALNTGVIIRRSQPKTKKITQWVDGKKTLADTTYYDYYIAENPKKFSAISTKYYSYWRNYTIGAMETRGLFNGPSAQAEKEFRDLSFECRRSKIEWRIRMSDPTLETEQAGSGRFEAAVEKKVEDCKKGAKINKSGVENLLTRYVQALKDALLIKARLDAKTWSYESEFQGIHMKIAITEQASDIGDITQQKITCENTLSLSDSKSLLVKLKNTSVETRAQIAEEMLKKTVIIEEADKLAQEKEEKEKREAKIREEVERRKMNVGDDMVKPDMSKLNF